MRIIGGAQRGTKLADLAFGDAGVQLRPTSDRVRENIFNLLVNGRYGNPLRNARVLDLFAGTGALSLEALSRGATCAMLIDNGPVAQGLIHANIARCAQDGHVTLRRCDCTELALADVAPFDLIFCDPPYGRGLGEIALDRAAKGGWLAPNALIVLEEASQIAPPAGFVAYDARRYGGTWVHLWGQEK